MTTIPRPRGETPRKKPPSKHHRIDMRVADPRRTARDAPLRRVYVWDVVVRVCHWLIALSIFTLAFTGYFIGRPFIEVSGEAGMSTTMDTFRDVHFYTAIVFTLAVLVRIYWAFMGSAPARWPNFIPVTRRRVDEMKETLGFYLFRRKKFPAMQSHNPLAGITYTLVFLIYLMMILTGLGLYGASAHVDSAMSWFAWMANVFGGLQSSRWLHHVGMWLLLGFFVHHLYSAFLAATVEKNGILESIFTGYKWSKDEDFDEKDTRRGGPKQG